MGVLSPDPAGAPGARPGHGLARKALAPRSGRYLVVGLFNTAVGYVLFLIVHALAGPSMPILVVLGISFFLSVCNAYLWQRRLVFRSKASWRREFPRFTLVNLAGLLMNSVLLVALIGFGMEATVSQAVCVLAVTIATYWAHKAFSFRAAVR